ncbi:uncharacterized protein LOC128228372 [Mya arenaria]|uniref:uncharacterized protein LOC128228372 n=1 Tax=Mya arenaria TaxID=6604 RepID=UPI0022E17389|nr:uncharacterized protein LOC128228372 [Mya arenaria]
MSNMTVHGDRPRCPEGVSPRGRGPLMVNGERKVIEGPMLENLTLSQSWNGCIWQLQSSPVTSPETPGHVGGSGSKNGLLNTYPFPGKNYVKDYQYNRRDSLLSKSRDSPTSLSSVDRPSSVDRLSSDRLSTDRLSSDRVSTDRLSSADRLSNGSERNRFMASYDDDSLTTASSNLDSSEHEEEYVTLDRSYVFPRSFRAHHLSHHSSMIDLKHNSLLSPKVNNVDTVSLSGTLPHSNNRKFRAPLRSVSVNETDLDAVDVNGKSIPWAKRSLKRIYENIGEALKSKPGTPRTPSDERVSIHSDYVGIRNDVISVTLQDSQSVNSTDVQSDSGKVKGPQKFRKRSKSLGELQLFGEENENELDLESGSDADGDDFGFLSHDFVHSSTAMHKSKSPLAPHRILPKRWRSKPRNSTAGQCLWSPEGNCTWCNVSGRRVVLRPISILQLSEAERLALQKIVLQKIQSCDLGCPVLIPKEPRESGRRKKHLLSIKRSKSANLTGIIHGLSEKDNKHGLVFGIPLKKCIANDNDLQRKRNSGTLKERKESDVILHRQGNRKSSSSSQGSLENCVNYANSFTESQKRNASSDSLSESESSRNTNSSLTDALSHTRHGSLGQSSVPLYATGPPQVPHIVKACFQHIETYGLRVLGIFRVGCSKKKTNQLRDEFDSGVEVKLNESHNPHEVGAVLKEYFRDLPEPLLTRDLYSPLIAAKGLPNLERQLEITRMLVSLLPVPSRDTLWALLQFLNNVEKHSTDAVDERGETLPGNKMDSHNLATLFGPNILHKAKQTEKEFAVESIERAEERKDVIAVIKTMIDHHQTVFQIPASLHDDVLRLLLETDPETTEQILKRISAENGIEVDPDTSSSYYDDSDASLPHSPISESNMQFRSTGNLSAMPLRVARSAEILTPTARRKFFYNDGRPDNSDNNGSIRRKSEVNNALEERPKFHLVIENSPSPPEVQKNPRVSRTERQGMTRDNSSPELYRRPHSMHLERPHSELYCTPKTLSIPTPDYARTNSDPYKSTSNSRSDSLTPERVTSSRAVSTSPRVTSSIQRPLNFNRATPEGENEWQKNRWRQWDNMTSHSPGDGNFEQETLV